MKSDPLTEEQTGPEAQDEISKKESYQPPKLEAAGVITPSLLASPPPPPGEVPMFRKRTFRWW